MSCCKELLGGGEPSNRELTQARGVVNTQPTAQPILEKPGIIQPVNYQPGLASPPPAILTHANLNAFNNPAMPPWGQAPSPPAQSQYGSPSPPIPSPPLGHFMNQNYNSSSNINALMQPQAAFSPTMSGHAVPMSSSPPIEYSRGTDEGKMSVAVDFGEHS